MSKALLGKRARNDDFMVALAKSRLLHVYVIVSAALVGIITLLQYHRYNLFGTNLLLGWDSPQYVWQANEVIAKGPLYLINYGKYPNLYAQLSAFLGYLVGNVTVIERVLPLVFCALLIYANARITLQITKNVHVAGLAAMLTAISIDTLRLYADLHRNLLALSLSFISFLFLSDFIGQNPFTKKSLLNKTYLSIVLIFLVIAGIQLETFFVLALSTILVAILSRSWRKSAILALAPTIPVAVLLVLFPKITDWNLGQTSLLTTELTFDEIFLWSGGSWIMFSFLIAGVVYVAYRALRKKDMLALAIFSWVVAITLTVILTIQRVIPLSAEYALRALMILPIPLLATLAVFAFAGLLKGVYFEIGVSSLTKRHAVKANVKHVFLLCSVLVLAISSMAITSLHYDEFLTPYIPKEAYVKVSAACQFLNDKGFSKPFVVLYGEHVSWFSTLYSSYIGAEIGEHYFYQGDVDYLLHLSETWSQYPQEVEFASPVLIITPYLYDKGIPYCLVPYHIGQGIYVIPPGSVIHTDVHYGAEVTVIGDNGLKEVRSEYLYASQDDPSLIVLRVVAGDNTSYAFSNYPSDWTFLKLQQGGDLSFPEENPRRFDGRLAAEGNDPAESTQDWSTLQTGTISIENSFAKEGEANLRIEGLTDSWGNLGARYNVQGTWDLTNQYSLAVWAKADENTPFSISLTDSAGNTRTYWDIQPDGASATTQWKRFTVDLNEYTGQSGDFDVSKVDSVDFYVYSSPGREMTFWIDDPIVDDALALGRAIYKARVLQEDDVTLYFLARLG